MPLNEKLDFQRPLWEPSGELADTPLLLVPCFCRAVTHTHTHTHVQDILEEMMRCTINLQSARNDMVSHGQV